MKNVVITVIVLGGIGYGIYHFTRPKPAFDVDRLEKISEALGEKAKLLGKMVDSKDLPDWAAAMDEYMKGVGDILDLHTGDCAETVQALEKHQADFKGRLLQGDMGDQMVFMQKIKEMPREQQQELAAKLIVMLHGHYQALLPMIKDFSYDCLKESAILYKVLR
ncbi:MAG TPA: hypothetical protein VM425_12100 [Myxococcota bacterium]|nr:hypothetical protein [Myxococcota bacterium]